MKTFSRFAFVRIVRVAAVFSAGVLSVTVGLAQIAPNVQRTKIAGIDVLIYKTGVQDVVTIRGSFPAGDAHAGEGNIAIPTLTGMLLDQGTTKQDKFAIADKLDVMIPVVSKLNVIKDLTGHGIGHKLHEEPASVHNFYKSDERFILTEGLVLAIEPFLTTGKGHIVEKKDGWSLQTVDKTIAAQFEHTIIVTKNEPIILTI